MRRINKKGGGYIIIIFGIILFTLVLVVLTSVFLVPSLSKINPYKRTITSNTENANIYPYTISQISFLKSKVGQETTAELLRNFYRNRDEDTQKKLDTAASTYLTTFRENCVTIDAWDRNNKPVWLNAQSEACRLAGTAAFLNPVFETNVIVPTENPEEYIVLKQKSIYLPPSK